jgi:hypothetical protein
MRIERSRTRLLVARANGTEVANSNNGDGVLLPPSRWSNYLRPVRLVVRLPSINEWTIRADHWLRPLKVVPRLKCKPVKGGGVESQG